MEMRLTEVTTRISRSDDLSDERDDDRQLLLLLLLLGDEGEVNAMDRSASAAAAAVDVLFFITS